LLEAIILFFIVVLASIIRIYKIGEIPYGFFHDEVNSGYYAAELMRTDTAAGQKLPIYIGDPMAHNMTGFLYIMAALFKLFGVVKENIRLTYAIAGILSIIALYFLTRYMYGRLIAICTTFIITFMMWHIVYSRVACFAMYSLLATIFLMFFIIRALKEEKWFDYILLGSVLGFSQYTYSTSKFLIFVIIIFFIYMVILFLRGKKKLPWEKMAVAILIFLIWLIPIFMYEIRHPGVIMERYNVTKIFGSQPWIQHHTGKNMTEFGYFLWRLKNHLLMFNEEGAYHIIFNVPGRPMLDFITGILFVLGLGFVLRYALKPENFLMIVMFIVALLPAAITIGDKIDSARTVMAVPVVAIFAGIAAGKIIEILTWQAKWKEYIVAIVLIMGAGYFIASVNLKDYFVKYEKSSWGMISIKDFQIGVDLGQMKGNLVRIIQPGCVPVGGLLDFFLLPEPGYEIFRTQENFIIKEPKVGYDYIFAFKPHYKPVIPSLEYLYPGGKYYELRHKYDNSLIYFSYYVPNKIVLEAKEREKEHGLKAVFYNNGTIVKTAIEPFLFREMINLGFYADSAEWSGKIKIDKNGNYKFIIQSDGIYTLEIDGKKVISNDIEKGIVGNNLEEFWLKTMENNITLGIGKHDIKVKFSSKGGFFQINLFWIKPGSQEKELVPFNVFYLN
jgi:4-amino-4-deoxy-L-arabinose transferase-like glycosyltransferase